MSFISLKDASLASLLEGAGAPCHGAEAVPRMSTILYKK